MRRSIDLEDSSSGEEADSDNTKEVWLQHLVEYIALV